MDFFSLESKKRGVSNFGCIIGDVGVGEYTNHKSQQKTEKKTGQEILGYIRHRLLVIRPLNLKVRLLEKQDSIYPIIVSAL